MKRRATRSSSKQRISIADHAPRLRIDARVAHPRRIADDDVESARGDHRREVNIEGKEIELVMLDALENLPALRDSRLQLAASQLIDGAIAAEEILRRHHHAAELLFVDIDGACEQIGGEVPIVASQKSIQRRTFTARRVTITIHEIALCPQPDRPLP